MTPETTESVRIQKDLLEKIRVIAKERGQTLSGYINVNMSKIVDRHWQKTTTNAKKSSV